MTYELRDIKEIRKRTNLTQHELAKRANVSQSLIAKVESGRLDPTFTKAQKIFDALENISKKTVVKAFEIMNKKIIPIKPGEEVSAAIKKMRRNDISQMPVIENDKAIGLITESTILNKMSEIEDPSTLKHIVVNDIMEECPPIVNANTTSEAVRSLLLHYPVILVAKEGKLIGLITKADLLDRIYRS